MVENESAVDIPSLASTHEEADTRLLLHAAHASNSFSRVVIWSPDTDVAILSIYFCASMGSELWFRTRVRDKYRYSPVHHIVSKLGQDLCRILPGLHALTGCDTASCFRGRVKIKAWQIVSEDVEQFKAQQRLGDDINVIEDVQNVVSRFVCAVDDRKSPCEDISLIFKI